MNRFALVLCVGLASCTSAPLIHGDAADKIHEGMTGAQVDQALGVPSARKASYGNGTYSWSYKYRDDANIHKLLHVTFSPDGRVLRTETEWDPDVYSKGGGKHR
jgi:outer membrane protein assembly factor BamE (lipoprotein component of BamABCDE complex)